MKDGEIKDEEIKGLEKKEITAFDSVEYREDSGKRQIRSYVLRSKKPADSQMDLVNSCFDKYSLGFEKKYIDFNSLYGNENKVIVEVGFGNGERLLKNAVKFPQYNFLGFEVYLNGFVRMFTKCYQNNLNNVKIMRFDAKDVISFMVPDNSIFGFEVFFPDPWPKLKHHKKRLVNHSFLNLISCKLISGGYFRMITDWKDYAEEVLNNLHDINTLYEYNFDTNLRKELYANEIKDIFSFNVRTSYWEKSICQNREIYEIIRLKL